jgi:phospholipase/lecithinase/hemolysin
VLGEVVSIVKSTMEEQANSALEEAAHFGLHATATPWTDITTNAATLMELVTYRQFCCQST